jgi:cell division protein FtsI (penicillin-binding protein 3)
VRPGPDPRQHRAVAIRAALVAGALAAGFAVVAGRAVQLQIFRREDLASMARDQYLRELTVKPRRGTIADRNGVTLAADAEADSVFVDPQLFLAQAKPGSAARLAKALQVDARALEKRIARGGRFAWVKRRVSPAESAAVRTLALPGVAFVQEFRRYYPSRDLAGQLLGVVGDGGEGQEGVERLHDEALRGESVRIPSLRDARGRFVLAGAPVSAQVLEGSRVELTIEQGLQLVAEQALARALERTRASAAMLVALDPATGEVLALANAPPFNPNAAKRTADGLRNRAVLDTFEPGSTMKTFTIAGALEAGAIRAGDAFDLERGVLRIGKHAIRDDHAHHEAATPATILAVSSNVGAAKIAQRLGRERLRDALLGFGFGERPGFGFAAEPRGAVPLARAEIALATQSFGYGLMASPVQVTAAMGALANGGVLMKPTLVRRIVDRKPLERGGVEEQVVFEARPAPLRRAVSPATAETMVRWLEGVVVEKHGTGKRARLERWRAAGKTGTAKKVDPVTGGYSSEKRFSSFVGFAPASGPRIVIGVFVDEPRADRYGGEAAAPVFREVAEWALQSFGVPPDPDVKPPPAEVQPAIAERPEAPEAPPVELAPAPPLAPGSVAVPVLDGLPARAAIRELERAELLGEIAGTGRVASQAPRPGQVVRRGTTVRVTLAPPG